MHSRRQLSLGSSTPFESSGNAMRTEIDSPTRSRVQWLTAATVLFSVLVCSANAVAQYPGRNPAQYHGHVPVQLAGHRPPAVALNYTVAPSFATAQNAGCANCGGAQCAGGQCGQSVPLGAQACVRGVDSYNAGVESRWQDIRPMDFGSYGPGGYVGPPRMAHVHEYRLRPGDQIQVVYLITRRQATGAYRLTPGDEVLVESDDDPSLVRGTLQNGLKIQPDGTISLRQIGQVHAAGLTVVQLRELLNREYAGQLKRPDIDVTPIRTNTLAEEIRAAVGGQSGLAQQAITVTVMADGNIRLPGIGEICVQGLSLNEMKREVNFRYKEQNVALDVEPILAAEAPHFIYVLGQVATPNRVQIQSPTTVLGAIASAGGQLAGANMRQVVIFRRAEDWRLISTMLDLSGAIYGRRPTPTDEIWVRDGDVVIVPAKPILIFNNFVEQVFTNGIYGVVPFSGVSIDLNSLNE